MTVSLPAPAAPPVPTGGKPASAPGKGVAHAHGLSGNPAKGGPVGDEATPVADMFAALVAALTQQMQPATDATSDDAAPASTPQGADGAAADVVPTPGVILPTLPNAATGVSVETETVPVEGTADQTRSGDLAGEVLDTVAGAEPVLDGSEPVIGGAEPVLDDADVGAAEGAVDAGQKKTDGTDRRATPAIPASPASHADGETTPAQRATPAEPAGQAVRAVDGRAASTAAVAEDADAPVPPPATNAAARVERPESAARVVAAAAARPADAHVQVARVVRPLRLGTDGAYELALDLTPAELGRVRIDVELRGSTINLSLRADNPATRELLQSSMDQLRAELEAAGLSAGQLDVGGRGPDGRDAPDDAAGLTTPVTDGDDDLIVVAPTDPADFDPANGLDVLA